MSNSELVEKLRDFAACNTLELSIEVIKKAADTIERLEREKAEAFKAGMKRAAEIAKGRYAVTGTNVAAAILAEAEKEVK